MKLQELRIGNYVFDCENYVDRVTAIITQQEDNCKMYYPKLLSNAIMLDNFVGPHSLSAIAPIKLTEEWLLKFGFDHHQGWLFKDAFAPGHPSQRFDLYWSKPDGFMMKSRYQEDVPDTFYMRHIQYVHQLQNLYFALTGEELIIKETK